MARIGAWRDLVHGENWCMARIGAWRELVHGELWWIWCMARIGAWRDLVNKECVRALVDWCMARIGAWRELVDQRVFSAFFCRRVASSWLWWLRRGFWWLRRGFWWLRRGFWWFRRGFWCFCGRLLYLPQGQQVSYLRCAEFRSTKASKFPICAALRSDAQRSASFRPALR